VGAGNTPSLDGNQARPFHSPEPCPRTVKRVFHTSAMWNTLCGYQVLFALREALYCVLQQLGFEDKVENKPYVSSINARSTAMAIVGHAQLSNLASFFCEQHSHILSQQSMRFSNSMWLQPLGICRVDDVVEPPSPCSLLQHSTRLPVGQPCV
jgi:hypothetical protein